MNKRDMMLGLLESNFTLPYTPAGFFLHFDKIYHRGRAAVNKHLEFFNYTGMDFIKIQYELTFPRSPTITKPKDWGNIPVYGDDFYEDHWQIVKGLVEEVGPNALVIMTLYSPYMCAGQISGKLTRDLHINESSADVKKGLEKITESLKIFVDGCIEHGIDGFYHSTQGGEIQRFGGSSKFDDCIKKYDLDLMDHVNIKSKFNILHICDYHGDYNDLSAFLDYPGDIVNCSLNVGDQILTGHQISEFFNKPFMGGLDRHGILVTGTKREIEAEVKRVIEQAPEKFILGADCTLPGDIEWSKIRVAIDFVHNMCNT
jgi:uroporphyrinogen decarboxylase